MLLALRTRPLRRILVRRCFSTRRNEVGIQMLPQSLRDEVFPMAADLAGKCNPAMLEKVKEHRKRQGLWPKEADSLPEVHSLQLPPLEGDSVVEHFERIANRYCAPYEEALDALLSARVGPMPQKFAFEKGWVQYSVDGKEYKPVEGPMGKAIVFDVEIMVTEGGLPALAVALTDSHWYSWCSDALIEGRDHRVDRITPEHLIPLGLPPEKEAVVIGHNVGFDRAYVREEYDLKCSKTRFLDTLSLHVCVWGQASGQKIKTIRKRNPRPEDPDVGLWSDVSPLNNLADVHELFSQPVVKLEKSQRKTFEKGSSDDVRADFQELMRYCFDDVLATHSILLELIPLFRERFPHKASLFGMMEMLTSYLPVDNNWTRFVEESENACKDAVSEIQYILHRVANKSCRQLQNDAFRRDVWLQNLDWSTGKLGIRKTPLKPRQILGSLNLVHALTIRQPFLCGYPLWYIELCEQPPLDMILYLEWEHGPWNTFNQKRCVPSLLKIMSNGYALLFRTEHGWGYLEPASSENSGLVKAHESTPMENFPRDEYAKLIEKSRGEKMNFDSVLASNDWGTLTDANKHQGSPPEAGINDTFDESSQMMSQVLRAHKRSSSSHQNLKTTNSSSSPFYMKLTDGILFRYWPHRNGNDVNVGNPLSKDFISKFEGDVLRSDEYKNANLLLKMSIETSYWKKSRERIMEQMVVWISAKQAAILPKIIPAGTVSRRAVGRTWLTASDAKKDRIGSEFKAMVQAPEGHHFVGADLDSEELWIASLIGDASSGRIHGNTAFGWMTLQGKKADGTDMHSRTAKTVHCSREQAKILNYARLYGAGPKFAARILKEFDPSLDESVAKERAQAIFRETKGVRQGMKWMGGTESRMFNKLEELARCKNPRTPFLGAIRRALEPDVLGSRYPSSRVNWIVQSSAVDYLHLMLLSMRYLFDKFGIDGRLVVKTHDEVRFMVRSEQRYQAALALHITNLYVRAFFASRVEMQDLPYGVAFFSAVDVDKALRREVSDDCVTPSNPHGLRVGHGIGQGEALDIYKTIELTGGRIGEEKNRQCEKSGANRGAQDTD